MDVSENEANDNNIDHLNSDNLNDSEDEEEGGQEIDPDERDFFQRELDALGWGLAGLRVGDGTEDVMFGEEAIGMNGSYTNGTQGMDGPGAGMDLGGEAVLATYSVRTPETPMPPPQWETADAATLDSWQNS